MDDLLELGSHQVNTSTGEGRDDDERNREPERNENLERSGPTAIPRPNVIVSTERVDPDPSSGARSPARARAGVKTMAPATPRANRAPNIGHGSRTNPWTAVVGTKSTAPATMNSLRPQE